MCLQTYGQHNHRNKLPQVCCAYALCLHCQLHVMCLINPACPLEPFSLMHIGGNQGYFTWTLPGFVYSFMQIKSWDKADAQHMVLSTHHRASTDNVLTIVTWTHCMCQRCFGDPVCSDHVCTAQLSWSFVWLCLLHQLVFSVCMCMFVCVSLPMGGAF